VDIQGITLVVHVGKPYTLMDFSHSSGRAGRKGEEVESVVFVSSVKPRSVYRDSEDSMMGQYIKTRSCCMEVLSGYLDMATVDCKASGGRLCDLWQDRQASSRRFKKNMFASVFRRSRSAVQAA